MNEPTGFKFSIRCNSRMYTEFYDFKQESIVVENHFILFPLPASGPFPPRYSNGMRYISIPKKDFEINNVAQSLLNNKQYDILDWCWVRMRHGETTPYDILTTNNDNPFVYSCELTY